MDIQDIPIIDSSETNEKRVANAGFIDNQETAVRAYAIVRRLTVTKQTEILKVKKVAKRPVKWPRPTRRKGTYHRQKPLGDDDAPGVSVNPKFL